MSSWASIAKRNIPKSTTEPAPPAHRIAGPFRQFIDNDYDDDYDYFFRNLHTKFQKN
jgi:hypothetical protein